jgi:threonine/homoserine/homoserine lactone efflux protein
LYDAKSCVMLINLSSILASVSLLPEYIVGSQNQWLSLLIIVALIQAILTLCLYDLCFFLYIFLAQYLNVSYHSIHSKQ